MVLHVVAVITAKPGKRDDVLAAVNANLAAVRAEEGCIFYAPFADAPSTRSAFGEDYIVILEQWASAEALAAHGKSAHMRQFREATADLISGPAQAHVLQPA